MTKKAEAHLNAFPVIDGKRTKFKPDPKPKSPPVDLTRRYTMAEKAAAMHWAGRQEMPIEYETIEDFMDMDTDEDQADPNSAWEFGHEEEARALDALFPEEQSEDAADDAGAPPSDGPEGDASHGDQEGSPPTSEQIAEAVKILTAAQKAQ